MKIAIIGTGNVGGALATQWSKAGHHIQLGVRNPTNFKGKDLLANGNTKVYSIAEAVNLSEVILVATPPTIVPALIETFGNVEHKVIIDATNTIGKGADAYPTAFHAFQALTDAVVVKCFNTTGFENMLNPNYEKMKLDMFMAGDNEKAKTIAQQLSADAGFANCYDFGQSDKVELLEKFALAWINLAIFQGMGRNIGFKLLQR